MAIKAISYKNWCSDNISPQSWSRVVLRAIDLIRKNGYKLKDFDEPAEDLDIPEDILEKLNETLAELYDIHADEELLNMY